MAGDSTTFLIDIEARLSGGDASITQLAKIGDEMLAAGASAVEFEQVTDRMNKALEDSTAALGQANKALAAGEASYKQAEIAADRAAKAVERLAMSGKTGDAFAKRQADAAEKAKKAADALKVEAAALDVLKAKQVQAAASSDSLSKGIKNVETASKKAADAEKAAAGTRNVGKIATALGQLGGPLGVVGQKAFAVQSTFDSLGTTLGSAGPYVALAVALTAIATSAIAATVAIAQWGVAMADANRTQTLLSAGIARTVQGGVELDAEISKLQDIVPQSSDELYAMARTLADSGLRGKSLTSELERTATAAARLKWGPEFGKQLLSLDNQARRFHSNIAGTFGGLKIEGLLEGLAKLVALFDSSTGAGQTMKFLFETIFQPIVDGAAGATVAIERLFYQAMNLALEAYIALKPYRTEIEMVGKAVLIGIGIIVGTLAAALALVVVAIAAVVAAIGALEYAIFEGWNAIFDFIDAFDLDQFINVMKTLGGDMIDGLVGGIKAKYNEVADALSGAVKGAVTSVEKFLGISSPSKLLYQTGVDTGEGYTQGVEATTDGSQAALEKMVAPPSGAAPGMGAAQAGGNTININIEVDGHGVTDESLAQKIANAVRDVFETDALMLGAGEEPAT